MGSQQLVYGWEVPSTQSHPTRQTKIFQKENRIQFPGSSAPLQRKEFIFALPSLRLLLASTVKKRTRRLEIARKQCWNMQNICWRWVIKATVSGMHFQQEAFKHSKETLKRPVAPHDEVTWIQLENIENRRVVSCSSVSKG